MSRSLTLVWAGTLLTTVALTGCHAGPPATDPFLNPVRVPPPSTGDITPIQPGMVSVPGGQPMPPVVVAPGTGYAPPAGNYNYGNGAGSIYGNPPVGGAPGYSLPATQTPAYPAPRSTIPLNAAPPAGTPPYTYPVPAQPGAGSIYNRQSSFDGSVGGPTRGSETAGTMTVARIGADQQPGSSTEARVKPIPDESDIDVGQVSQASYESPAAETPTVQPRRSTRGTGPADRGETYGFDPNYAWLHGKLEYSQIQGHWKLRYIPLDGETDTYGGSVILGGETPLTGHKPGEFVSVTGAIAQQAEAREGFAPTYRVDQVVRLSD